VGCTSSRNRVRAKIIVAERQEIADRHADWEIIGAPEYQMPGGGSFTPWLRA
jgi:hypothetical protein